MIQEKSGNKRIAKNSIYMSIRMFFVLFLTFYTTRVVLKILGVEDYGVYNVVGGFVSMFTFLNLSMTNAIQRFYNYELGKHGVEGAHKVFIHALYIQFVIAFILLILTESLGVWYVNNKMVIPEDRLYAANWIFQSSIIGFVFLIFQAPFSAAVMSHEKMGYFSFVGVLDAVSKLVIVLIIPFLEGDRLIWYGFLYALINLLDCFLYYFYARSKFQEVFFSRVWDRKLFKSMIVFSGWNFFGTFSNLIKEQGLNLILNLFFGPVVNAARGIAQQINGGIQGFVSNITVPVRPQIVQSYAKGEYGRVMNLTYSVSKLSSCFLFLMALPVMVEIDFILKIWLGHNIPEHAAVFVIIVIIQSVANNLNSSISGVVHASGQMKRYQLTGCIINISSLPIAYLALKLGGSAELALTITMIITFIMQYAALIVLKSIITYSLMDYLRLVIIPFGFVVLLSLVPPLLCHNLLPEGWMRFVIVGSISTFSVVIATIVAALTKKERSLIFSIIKNRKL